tara:strand:- start:74756 stop:75442 length:687 start_codon:yes stop_codon:yes gene_type:complete
MTKLESLSLGGTTRAAIRDAAEDMYATNGIDGVTTRALAERAKVNMAAINYHFGNKDNLMLVVFRDVARRTVQRRLDYMTRIDAQALEEGRPPRIQEVVEAFVDAYVNEDSPRTGILLAHFVLQHRVRPTEWTRQIVREELDDFAVTYMAMMRRAAPHLSEAEIHWRYHLMVGAVMMSLSDQSEDGRMAQLSEGLVHPEDRTEFRTQLIAFLVDSFGRGPATHGDIKD